MNIEVVDLFCGVGGLTHGLSDVGFNVVAGYDNDETCEYAYTHNNNSRFFNADIRQVTGEDINANYSPNALKILVGCAPCQPFSLMRSKLGERNELDEKYNLLLEFGRLIKETHPTIISMENVPQLKESNVFLEFVKILDDNNYFYDMKVVFCPEYGICQTRRRFVLVASLLGEIEIIPPTHNPKDVHVRDFIFNLPKINAGEICHADRLHQSAKLSDKNLRRIKCSKPGGTWKDWPSDLVCDCHKKKTGSSYTSVYGRMSWDSVGPTITTQFYSYGTGRYGHPTQNRALSLREGALLQTFPLNYDFINPDVPFSFRDIARHIGNAVPVRLGQIIGLTIQNHLRYYNIIN